MALLLDLREIRGSEKRIDHTYPAETFSAASEQNRRDDYVVADGVWLGLLLRRDGDKCRVAGRVRSVLRQTCSRCLEPFDVPSDLVVDLLYLPQSANRGEAEIEIAEDDLSTAFYRDGQIDLTQMVREQFQLSLPMKPLCRDDCQGLCAVCGANLNERRCNCDTRWHDPRMAALETLLSGRQRH